MELKDLSLGTTLFVSDLDGTLLGEGAVFPHGLDLVRRINALTERGVRLTYATARTIQTVRDILSGIRISAPVALMNGVLIRDMTEKRYLSAEYLTVPSARNILETMEEMGIAPFIYALRDGELSTSYTDRINPYMRSFMEERIRKYNKPFTRLERLSDGVTGEETVIYIVMIDSYATLLPVYRIIEADPTLRCAFYRDSYETDIWYLEVFSAKASKGEAIRHLRRMTGAETVVAFGDNRNDLPMFAESDIAIAVANAPEEVKGAADLVIGGVDEGGVVSFLEERLGEWTK